MLRAITVAGLGLLLTGCVAGGPPPPPQTPAVVESTPTPRPTPPGIRPAAEPLSREMIAAARGLDATTYEHTLAAYGVLHVAAQRDCYPMLNAVDPQSRIDLELQYARDIVTLTGKAGLVSPRDKVALAYAATVAAICSPVLSPR